MTQKVVFLVPDGVGIRNFLYASFIQQLAAQGTSLAIWSTLPESAFETLKSEMGLSFSYSFLELQPENVWTRVIRESANFARLKANAKKVNNPTILQNWNYRPHSRKLRLVNQLAQRIGTAIHKKPHRIVQAESWAKKGWDASLIEAYKTQLKEANPDCIFITHQRVAGLMPICLAAKSLGIPVVSAIYSWDNLPKARLVVDADYYVVWSNYMKSEMKLYYPDITQDRVLVTGTPQFEFYNHPNWIRSREAFANAHGLDPSKRWICYSGDDVLTSPNDPYFLEDVAKAIQNSTMRDEVQVVFRRCPVDFSDRYDWVLKAYPNLIISIDPLWNQSTKGWTGFYPSLADISMLVNLVEHTELVINLGSTMAHDFAVKDKPCLYLNYNKPYHPHWNVETIYQFQHFRSMDGLDAVGWLTDASQIADQIRLALDAPQHVGKDRQSWLQKIVQHPLDYASTALVNHLNRLACTSAL